MDATKKTPAPVDPEKARSYFEQGERDSNYAIGMAYLADTAKNLEAARKIIAGIPAAEAAAAAAQAPADPYREEHRRMLQRIYLCDLAVSNLDSPNADTAQTSRRNLMAELTYLRETLSRLLGHK